MDNIGDWLYIVFIIIAAGSSILSSGKKKREEKEILGQPGKVIITSNRKPLPEKSSKTNAKTTRSKEPTISPQPPLQVSHFKPTPFLQGEYVSEIQHQDVVSHTIFTDPEPENTSEFAIHNAEDLRKAIIYTEILNRKY